MPVSPTYPGVYVLEIPSGVRTITGVSTSIAAFVDSFDRGPLDTPVRLLSFADFEREFGGLQKTSPASYGIRQFFLNGGQQAYAIRVGAEGPGAPPVPPLAVASVILQNDAGTDLFKAYAGKQLGGQSRRNPGLWGNALRIEIDQNTGIPAEVFAGQEAIDIQADELFNLTVLQTIQDGGRQVVVNAETFRNLTLRADVTRNAIQIVNAGSGLVQLEEIAAPPASLSNFRPSVGGTLGDILPVAVAIPVNGAPLTVDVGTGGRTENLNYGGAVPATYAQLRPHLQNAIRAAGAVDPPIPMLTGAVVQLIGAGANQRFRVQLGRSGTDYFDAAIVVLSNSVADDAGLTAAAGSEENVQLYSLGSTVVAGSQAADTDPGFGVGFNGIPADAAAILGNEANKTGIHALRDVDLFNILCIPKAADFVDTQQRAVYSAAVALCNEERSFLIVDIPEDVNDIDSIETWITDNATLRDKNAAVYFPRVRVPDPLDDFRAKNFASSGTIAGLMARTDTGRGIWKAPAGTDANLRGVGSLQFLMDDRENGVINPLAINALRVFPTGIVSWGARTLVGFNNSGQDDHRYVPVRRFQLFLEESLYRGLKFAVFEPNDEPLWAQIRLAAGSFMNNLFRQGAFQGQKSSDAYFVKCDSETTTQNDINLGVVNVLVGFAPLKPAEFVIISLQQRAGEVQT